MVAMEYCKHEVLVLERGQNLFTVDHARAMEAMENDEHEVLVLEVGQNLFIDNHARTMVAMEKLNTECSYSKEVTASSPSTMREQWWRWKSISTTCSYS
mmetsp:Transcript_82289/g.164496  ORF Transcript_82289/g.164496 Transcript_82289/m.164496 type:complete len:99 (+) Transcript_82289:246-542(+)